MLDGVDTDILESFLAVALSPTPRHQSVGHPVTSQGHPPPNHCTLLLQLDSDTLMGVMCGDGGRLLIWAPTQPWRAGTIEGCTIEMDSD